MFPIGTIIKWVVIGSAISMLGIGANKLYNMHKDAITLAVNDTKKTIVLEQNELQRERENDLREQSREDLEAIQVELIVERRKVSDMKKMLLIDHDLDNLLQKKPGLIINIVNKGTEEYYRELEEITQ